VYRPPHGRRQDHALTRENLPVPGGDNRICFGFWALTSLGIADAEIFPENSLTLELVCLECRNR
jgi:hypothetical protein